MLIDFMSKGFSFEAFAGHIGVAGQTIYTWTDKHPEFLEAKKEAFEKSRVFWESAAIEGLWNQPGEKTLNNAAWVFNMKNRFGWTDRREVQSTNENKTVLLAYNLEDDDESE